LVDYSDRTRNLVQFRTIIVNMIRVNVHDAKTRFSSLLEAAKNGETIVICNRNKPVAELKAVEQPRTKPRKLGQHVGVLAISEDFNDPLSDEEMALWESPIL
jgi:prevent-host-death family protein